MKKCSKKVWDYSAHRAREMLLQRGFTNRSIAAEIGCSPDHVKRMVNGMADCRGRIYRLKSGSAYERLCNFLKNRKCDDIVEHLNMVPLRRAGGRVLSLGELSRSKRKRSIK